LHLDLIEFFTILISHIRVFHTLKMKVDFSIKKVDERGRVLIPKAWWKVLKIGAGDHVLLTFDESFVKVEKWVKKD